jgi:hypothetical protein
LSGSVIIKFPAKVQLSTDANYVNNGNRTPGYNLNFFILNAGIEKAFFKSDVLVVSFVANDILNQNISNERFISTNQIVDRKTEVIRRYYLLKVLFKFNSNKKDKSADDD